MATALRTDEVYQPVSSVSQKWLAPYLLADSRYSQRRTRKFRVNTGLSDDLVIETNEPELPQAVLGAIERLSELTRLEPNWDSYGACVVDRQAIRPSLDIALQALQFCQTPRIHANNAGGVDLFWDSQEKSLEISVTNAEVVCVYFEDRSTGEEIDSEEPVNLEGAKTLVRRYCGA